MCGVFLDFFIYGKHVAELEIWLGLLSECIDGRNQFPSYTTLSNYPSHPSSMGVSYQPCLCLGLVRSVGLGSCLLDWAESAHPWGKSVSPRYHKGIFMDMIRKPHSMARMQYSATLGSTTIVRESDFWREVIGSKGGLLLENWSTFNLKSLQCYSIVLRHVTAQLGMKCAHDSGWCPSA